MLSENLRLVAAAAALEKLRLAAAAALDRGERLFEFEGFTYRAERLAGVGAGAVPLDIDGNFVCQCDACSRDGQHEAGCSVHLEPPACCDCLRGTGP